MRNEWLNVKEYIEKLLLEYYYKTIMFKPFPLFQTYNSIPHFTFYLLEKFENFLHGWSLFPPCRNVFWNPCIRGGTHATLLLEPRFPAQKLFTWTSSLNCKLSFRLQWIRGHHSSRGGL